jgi:phosphopantetheinyl transferase (holo-ACP synthase)
MVGNDVVDMGDREILEGPAHPRFDLRVFAPEERAAMRASGQQGRIRWLLWSAKEAAYKLARKLDPGVVFSPSRFVVELEASGDGTVVHEGRRFAVRSAEAGKALHTLALDAEAPSGRLLWAVQVRRRGADPSRAARALATRVLAEELGIAPDAIHFERRGRVPSARAEGLAGPLDLSLSHHGRFVAFACDVGPPK